MGFLEILRARCWAIPQSGFFPVDLTQIKAGLPHPTYYRDDVLGQPAVRDAQIVRKNASLP